jgi:CheY-like chemotaxis protein
MGILQTSAELGRPRRQGAEGRGGFPRLSIPNADKPRRRVLIVEEVPSPSNMLQVLLNVLNCESETALGRDQALAMIARADYDAVLLDLRHADASAKPWLSQIRKIRPSMVNRVLVITGEVEEPSVVGQFGPRYLPRDTDIRLMEYVHQRLLALWAKTANCISEKQIDPSSSGSIDKFRKEMRALVDDLVSRLQQSVRPFQGATVGELRTELQKAAGSPLGISSARLRKQTEEALRRITEQLKVRDEQVASEAADIFRARIAEIFAILRPVHRKTAEQEMPEFE